MIIHFSKYDKDGIVTSLGGCSEEDFPLQLAEEGGGILVGTYPPDRFYVENGVPVEIPLDQIEKLNLLSEQDRHCMRWDTEGKLFVDRRTLEELKYSKLHEFKSRRDSDIKKDLLITLPSSNKEVFINTSLDTISRLQLYSNKSDNVYHWRLPDNSWAEMSGADASYILNAITDRLLSTFDKFQLLEAEILKITSVSELRALEWS